MNLYLLILVFTGLLGKRLSPHVVANDTGENTTQPRCEVPMVRTTSGTVKGYSPRPGIQAFEGIPYAHPATRRLRFAAPQSIATEDRADIEAVLPISACYQVSYNLPISDKFSSINVSEDCLIINV